MKIKLVKLSMVLLVAISGVGCSFQSATVMPSNGDPKIETDGVSEKTAATGKAVSDVIMALGFAAMLGAAGSGSGTAK